MQSAKSSGRAFGVILPALIALSTACSNSSAPSEQPVELDGPFVAIPRELTGTATAALTQALETKALPAAAVGNANETFYIAINKNELGQKWFLSAYMHQLFPRVTIPAFSLGTRVVTFKIQNGKLFVFDVDDRKATSNAADPEVIVEAYPIVNSPLFAGLPNSSQYVLFDPAAGLNRFGMITDAFASPADSSRFEVDLIFSQRFRKIADGATFEQVFTGSTEVAYHEDPIEPSGFRFSGSVGIALRRYSEGAGYVATQMPQKTHYFTSDLRILKNQSNYALNAASWNVKPGMKPIVWKISRDALVLAADPRFQQYDVVGAIKAGVENWNKAFGFKVLEARIAEPSDSPADDDTNYLFVDLDLASGGAFANWRTNPNTGEIRGASVYFSALWAEIADIIFEDDVPQNLTQRLAALQGMEKSKMPLIKWGPMAPTMLCMRHATDFADALGDASVLGSDAGMTKKEKFERYLAHVVNHEIGHTLGLRHNFKGSLVGTSSSVMEYIDDLDAVFHDAPGPYDVDAIKYLYGLSTTLPTQPFCTDEGTVSDPDCAPFDVSDDPLNKLYGPQYAQSVNTFLAAQSNSISNSALNNVLKYVRADAVPARRLAAFSIATQGFAVPLDPAKAANPQYALRADFLMRILLNRLYLDAPATRGSFTADPSATDAALSAAVFAQVKGTLLNTDGARSFPTRRVAVDILKKLQTDAAHRALQEAKTIVAAQKLSLSGDDLLRAEDLLARINAALSPYFIK